MQRAFRAHGVRNLRLSFLPPRNPFPSSMRRKRADGEIADSQMGKMESILGRSTKSQTGLWIAENHAGCPLPKPGFPFSGPGSRSPDRVSITESANSRTGFPGENLAANFRTLLLFSKPVIKSQTCCKSWSRIPISEPGYRVLEPSSEPGLKNSGIGFPFPSPERESWDRV